MGGSTYVALGLCITALQAVVVLAAARYGARKALAKVEAIAALTAERIGRIEEHLDDEPAAQHALDPSVEAADRSGLFAPNPREGMDCG